MTCTPSTSILLFKLPYFIGNQDDFENPYVVLDYQVSEAHETKTPRRSELDPHLKRTFILQKTLPTPLFHPF